MITLEFYNKVHSKQDGKFANTPGPGHAKGAPKATPKQTAALKKVLSGPKTKAGSVVVAHKTAAIKSSVKPAPATKPKPTPVAAKPPAKKPAPAPPKPVVKKPTAKPAPKPAVKPEPETKKKVTVKKEIAEKVKAKPKVDDNDTINKPIADLPPGAIDTLNRRLMKNKDASKDYEIHGSKDDPDSPYGYIVNAFDSDHFYDMKKGQTVQQGIDAMNKTLPKKSKEAEEYKEYDNGDPKETPESKRISSILTGREHRLSKDLRISDMDEIGAGKAIGMNETPPPVGLKAAKLSDDHIAAMGEYRGMEYKRLNTALRSGKPLKGEVAAVVADLDDAFTKAGVTTKEITVYRGTKKGLPDNFTDKAFTSTTYQENNAKEFGDVVIKIVIPKGTRVLKLSGGFAERHFQGEAELLLPRGSTYVKQSDGSYKVVVNTATN